VHDDDDDDDDDVLKGGCSALYLSLWSALHAFLRASITYTVGAAPCPCTMVAAWYSHVPHLTGVLLAHHASTGGFFGVGLTLGTFSFGALTGLA
jgi:hypothetical protein